MVCKNDLLTRWLGRSCRRLLDRRAIPRSSGLQKNRADADVDESGVPRILTPEDT